LLSFIKHAEDALQSNIQTLNSFTYFKYKLPSIYYIVKLEERANYENTINQTPNYKKCRLKISTKYN